MKLLTTKTRLAAMRSLCLRVGLTAAAMVLATTAGPIFVQAQSLRPALRDLNETLNLLIAVKKSAVSDQEKDQLEISLRQSAFNDIIAVSLTEIEFLRKKLGDLTDTEEFLKALTGFESYYQSLRNTVNRDIAFEEIVNLGRQFKIWREAIYQPTTEEITRAILKNHNQKIITVASRRFELITVDLEKIKNILPSAKWNQLMELLEAAGANIEAAKESEEKEPTLVVNKIKEAYSHFLEMSKLVRK